MFSFGNPRVKPKQVKISAHKAVIEELKLIYEDEKQLLVKLQELNNNLKFSKKEDLESWVEALKKLQTVLDKCKTSPDSQSAETKINLNTITDDFYRQLLLALLRFYKTLLENSYNRYLFPSSESLSPFLDVDDDEILIETLRVYEIFVKRHSYSRRSSHESYVSPAVLSKIFALAQGWSGKETGLPLSLCLTEETLPALPLYFDFFVDPTMKNSESMEQYPLLGKNVIHIPNLHQFKESPTEILSQMITKFHVPLKYHFPLFARIRLVKAFPHLSSRTKIIHIRLLSFIILAQAALVHESSWLTGYFRAEPDFLPEAVDILNSEKPIPANIRATTVRSLASLIADSTRLAAVLAVTGCHLHHGVLPTILRRAVANISNSLNDPIYTPEVIESLIYFVTAVVSTPTGAAALKGSGLIAVLLPLITSEGYQDPVQLKVVGKIFSIVELLLDSDDTVVELFRELNGLDSLIKRIDTEVKWIEKRKGKEEMTDTVQDEAHDAHVDFLKALLGMLIPCLTGRLNVLESTLPEAMKTVFTFPAKFGGAVYSLFISILSTLIHNEPAAYNALNNTGIPTSFLNSLTHDLLPSSSALSAIPGALSAICLNEEARAKVSEMNVIAPLFAVFADPKYITCLAKRNVNIGSSMDELLRHNNTLKAKALESCLKMLNDIIAYGEKIPETNVEKYRESVSDMVLNASKFLEALFANGDHNQAFIDRKGHELMMRFYTLPGLPSTFFSSVSARSLSQALQTLSMHNSNILLKSFIDSINSLIKEIDTILPTWREGNVLVKSLESEPRVSGILSTIHNFTGVLVMATALAEWSTDAGIQAFNNLGSLQRVLLWDIGAEAAKTNTDVNLASSGTISDVHPMDVVNPLVPPQPPLPTFAEAPSITLSPINKPSDIPAQLVSSIHNLSKALAKVIAGPSRRRDEKAYCKAAENAANVIIGYLVWEAKQGGDLERATYYTNAIGQIRSLLFDERRGTTHTMFLLYFVHNGGVDQIFNSLNWLVKNYIARVSMKKEEGEKDLLLDRLDQALAGYGKFIKFVTNSGYLMNSPVTHNMMTIQNLPGQRGAFDPHKFFQDLCDRFVKLIVPLWENPNLKQLPSSFLVPLIHISKQLLDNETKPSATSTPSVPAKKEKPAFQPDPALVSQLMEMGFSKGHVEDALRQIGSNNGAAATEWLLNNPEEIIPESTATIATEDESMSEDTELAMALAMSLGVDASSKEVSPPAPAPTPVPQQKQEEQETAYDVLRKSLLEVSFDVLSQAEDVSPHVGELLSKYAKKKEDESMDKIIESLFGRIRVAMDTKANNVGSLLQSLNGLVVEDLGARRLLVSMNISTYLLDIIGTDINTQKEEPSKWLGNALTVLDTLLQLPYPTQNDKSSEKTEKPTDIQVLQPILPVDQQQILSKLIMGLLHTPIVAEATKPLLLIISRLTRDPEFASFFLQQKGIESLLSLKTNEFTLIGIILSHILEDQSTLQSAMEAEISNVIAMATARPNGRLPAKTFLTNLAAVLCRDPQLFMIAAANTARVYPGSVNIIAAPKKPTTPAPAPSTSTTSTTTTTTTTTAEDKKKKKHSPVLKQVVNVLLNYLVEEPSTSASTSPMKEGKKEETSASAVVSPTSASGPRSVLFPPPSDSITSATVLQLLADLISAYPAITQVITRHTFAKPTKGSSNMIHYILREFIGSNPAVVPGNEPDYQAQQRASMANRVITSLCTRSEGRKKVITEINHVIQQQLKSHNLLQSLGDLLFMLLVSKSQPGTAVSTDIARIMLELDLVHTLTEAIKAIDFNYPDAADTASSLVKPLELLSRLASTLKFKDEATVEHEEHETSAMNTTTEEMYHPQVAMETEEEEEIEIHDAEEEEQEENENDDNEENEEENSEDEEGPIVSVENWRQSRAQANEEDEEEEEEDEDNEEDDEEEEEEEDESASSDDEQPAPNSNFFSAEIPIPDLPGASIVFETRGGNADALRDPIRLLQTLLPGIGLESDGPGGLISRRVLEGEVGRLFGLSPQQAQQKSTVQRWTDDGQKANANMIAYATSFESYLLEKLNKITTEEREEKEKIEKEKAEKEKQEKEKEASTKMEVEPTVVQVEPTPQVEPKVETPATTTTTVAGPSTETTTTAPPPTETAAPTTAPAPQPPADPIDPTFLEALPEELRAELLATQLGNTSTTSNVSTSTLNPDFLAALPPDIQAEMLAQETARVTEPAADPSRAQEMDNASFLATLPPELREEILMTSDDSFIATLPPQLAAEAHTLQERAYRGFRGGGFRFGGSPFESAPVAPASVSATRAEAPKVVAQAADTKGKPALEEDSIVTLVKILYMQQPLARGLLQKILLNACYYDLSRRQLLRVLMAVLSAYLKRRPTVETKVLGSTLGETLDMLNLKSQSSDFSPLENPFHAPLGYSQGITYNFIEPKEEYPPLLVSKRILELLSHIIKHNASVTDDLLRVENEEKILQVVDLNKMKAPVGELFDLVGSTVFAQNSSVHIDYLMNAIVLVTKVLIAKQKKREKKETVAVAATTSAENVPTTAETTETAPTTENAPTTKAKVEEPAKEEPKVEETPLKIILSDSHQNNLISILSLHPSCTEQSFRHINTILDNLVTLEAENREPLLAKVVQGIDKTANTVQASLSRLISDLETQAPAVALSTLSYSISSEINLLRLLRTLATVSKSDPQRIEQITSQLQLDSLWKTFEIALAKLSSAPIPTLSPLLPVIEAFFVVNGASLKSSTEAVTTTSPSLSRFIKFAETYRKLLNDLIKQNPSLLEDSFYTLLKMPQLIDFENKRAYFKDQLSKKDREHGYPEIRLNVRRNYVMEDSFYQLRARRPEELKGRVNVHFAGEEGIDAGGLTREWYMILAREMFNPNYALFEPTPDGTFQPSKNSFINHEHLGYFKFIGRVIGKAIHDGQLLDAHFTRSYYKHILGLVIHYTDIESIDPDYFKNLKWILENDITDVLESTFSVQSEEFGVMKLVELVPGGSKLAVTNENKEEYVKLITEHKMTTSIKPQISAFLEGFYELIPKTLVSIFTPQELELLISGLPDIDIEDLRLNTEYKGYTVESKQIQWFWQVVAEFDREQKALLLQFVTGTSKVPLEGFKGLQGMSGLQKFQIQKAYETTRLPSAHTCFNQLDLPEYDTKEQLYVNLMTALREGSEGFGFG